MTLPIPDKEATLAAVRTASERLASLYRAADDPARPALGIWTVGDVAAHTTHLFGLFGDLTAGGRSPVADHLRMSETWDRLLADDPERDPRVLADRIEPALKSFLDAAGEVAWDAPVTWHGGLPVPVYALACLWLTECDLHGYDVAAVTGRPWSIPAPDARLIFDGLFPVLPYFVDRGAAGDLRAAFEIRVRGGSRVFVTIEDGTATIDTAPPPGKIDCRISADPVEYLLVGYGRRKPWGPALRGKVVAWGRKPWLGLRFPRLFHSV